jgi:tol-pal system protein YbgF
MNLKALMVATVAVMATVVQLPAHAQSVTSAPPPSENLTRLQSRVDELEGLLRDATADSERLSIELRRTKAENVRLQRLLDDALASQQPGGPPAADAAAPSSPAPSTPRAAATPREMSGTTPVAVASGSAQAFGEARRLLDATRWQEAELALAGFLREYADAPEAPEARYFLGRTQIVLGRHGDAAATFLELLRKSPASARAPDAWVRLGVSLKGMGETAQACATFRDLPLKYPAATAAVRQLALNEARAAQCR